MISDGRSKYGQARNATTRTHVSTMRRARQHLFFRSSLSGRLNGQIDCIPIMETGKTGENRDSTGPSQQPADYGPHKHVHVVMTCGEIGAPRNVATQ